MNVMRELLEKKNGVSSWWAGNIWGLGRVEEGIDDEIDIQEQGGEQMPREWGRVKEI